MIAKKKAKQLKTTIFSAKNVRPETLATHDAMADAAVTAAQAYPISWLADKICTKAIKVKTPVTIKQSLVICNFLLAFCSRASVLAQNFSGSQSLKWPLSVDCHVLQEYMLRNFALQRTKKTNVFYSSHRLSLTQWIYFTSDFILLY